MKKKYYLNGVIDSKKVSNQVQQFILDSGAEDKISEIKKILRSKNNGIMPPFSDLVDKDGNQYVNYIQEGGGVLGVALVGYTYTLEKLGIRFAKVAGTSAGAINTLLLAAVDVDNYTDEKGVSLGYQTQSEAILHEMLTFDFWNLVDGHPLARLAIKKYLSTADYFKKIKSSTLTFLIILITCSLITTLYFIPQIKTAVSKVIEPEKMFRVFGLTTLILLVSTIALFIFAKWITSIFARSRYGINTGKNFLEWMINILARNKIETTKDLEEKIEARTQNLILRSDTFRPNSENSLEDNSTKIEGVRIKFIASDIVNQIKVEFPSDAGNYWYNPDKINPATYVRASMAIPFFFEPLIANIEGVIKHRSVELEAKELRTDVSEIYFVDGGALSNFPINAFYNPKIIIPRMPTFGAKIEDSKHITSQKITDRKLGLFEFSGSMLNTIRSNYDKDFIARNNIYKRGIGYIDVNPEKFSWLNFNISDSDQLELFKQGVDAAYNFFIGGKVWIDGIPREFHAFNWIEFRDARSDFQNGLEIKVSPSTSTPKDLKL